MYSPERGTILDLITSIMLSVSWGEDCYMLLRLVSVWILRSKFILAQSHLVSFLMWNQIVYYMLPEIYSLDHVCVVWGWICCVGDGCAWNTKWSNNQFNWCYGWESMWDTVQVSKGFFRHLQLWRAKLITVKSVIISCQPERALLRLTIVWFCHFQFKHIRY